ncbi:hypothetical protein [Owenweeksia hongkongensis]|uniref:hypothetical protein n=1 Tax=Owenweeksia hongkongensis TaxID=253245 RepID=UPI003A950E23
MFSTKIEIGRSKSTGLSCGPGAFIRTNGAASETASRRDKHEAQQLPWFAELSGAKVP